MRRVPRPLGVPSTPPPFPTTPPPSPPPPPPPPSPNSGGPVIFFSDLESGPNIGGQNDNGTILTLYGKRFGPTQGGSTITVGGGQVALYLLWSDSKGAGCPVANAPTTKSAGPPPCGGYKHDALS